MDQNNPNDVIENDPEQQRLDFEQIVDQVVQNVLPLVEQRRQLRQQLQSQGMPNGAFQELQRRLFNVQGRLQQQEQQTRQQFFRLHQQEMQQRQQQQLQRLHQNNPNNVVENVAQNPEPQRRLDFRQIVDQVEQNVLPLIQQQRELRQQLQPQGEPNGALQELQRRLFNVQGRLYQQRQQIRQQFFRWYQQEMQQRQQQQFQRLQQPVIGLTPARIGGFEHFNANEAMVGEQCNVCLEDLEAGTQMVRLDCHISHYFCRNCIYVWFENNNKCPLCNRVFH